MQITAPHLMIAAQAAARAKTPIAAAAKPTEPQSFEPLGFAKAKAPVAVSPAAPPSRPGTQLDITV